MPWAILEGRMTRSAIRLLALTICATALAGAPAASGTSHGKHIKKHGFRIVRPAWPGVSPARSVRRGLPRHGSKFRLQDMAAAIR